MSEIFHCKIIPRRVDSIASVPLGREPAKYHPALIHIKRAKTPGLIEVNWIWNHRDFYFQYGDTITCVQGVVFVWIRPNTTRASFSLGPEINNGQRYNMKTVLEINKETTKIVARSGVNVTKDIGNVNSFGGGSTR